MGSNKQGARRARRGFKAEFKARRAGVGRHHADEIELCYLPSYASELNADEYLNGDLKLSVAKRVPARDRAVLLRTATARLRSLQQQPERVMKFFQHPRVQYAV